MGIGRKPLGTRSCIVRGGVNEIEGACSATGSRPIARTRKKDGFRACSDLRDSVYRIGSAEWQL